MPCSAFKVFLSISLVVSFAMPISGAYADDTAKAFEPIDVGVGSACEKELDGDGAPLSSETVLNSSEDDSFLPHDASLDEDAVEPETSDGLAGEGVDSSDVVSGTSGIAGVEYSSHVSNIGWMSFVKDGSVAGTTGRALSMEALRVHLIADDGTTDLDSQISIQAHVASKGWMDSVVGGAVAGTTGRALAMEAVRIRLEGDLANSYDVWYRVHSADFGWLDWASNGESAGSAGYSRAAEAIQIKVLPKGSAAPGETDSAFKDRSAEPASLSYAAHMSNVGWYSAVSNSITAGSTGVAQVCEALRADISWYGHNASILMRGCVEGSGWQSDWSSSAGTTGQAKKLNAFEVLLGGDASEQYDVYYRSFVSGYGWLGWTANGLPSGVRDGKNWIQAVQIQLVDKGQAAPGDTENAFVGDVNSVNGSGTIFDGASAPKKIDGGILTIGDSSSDRPLSNASLGIDNLVCSGELSWEIQKQFSGWKSYTTERGITKTISNDAEPMRAIKMSLSGDLAERHCVAYRVCIPGKGWLDWAIDGDIAGSSDSSIIALQVKLVPRDSVSAGEFDGRPFAEAPTKGVSYQSHVADYGWLAPASNGKLGGTTGEAKSLQALRIGLDDFGSDSSISVQSHVAGIGWQNWAEGGSVSGTVGQNRAIEAVKIKLSGAAASEYDIYYRMHVADYGWLGWAKNGEVAGTTGLAKQAEAIQVRLVEKGSSDAPESVLTPSVVTPSMSAETYIQGNGWQSTVGNGGVIGTTGQSRAMKGLCISIDSSLAGDIVYSAHVQDIGWQSEVKNGELAGAQDCSKQIEAVKIRLSGNVTNYFDVWYRAHVASYGWLDWTKNGEPAGTTGIGYELEALQIRILPKDSSAPGSTARPFATEANDYVMGVQRSKLVAWLSMHQYDGYYLGTPYSAGFTVETCMYPNGARRWDGFAGMNCTGFVAHAYRMCGGDLGAIGANNNHSPWSGGPGGGSYINAWRWYGYAVDSGAKMYTFNSVWDMLASGVAQKGDIIFFKTDGSIDCHIGFFWGDSPSDNKMWHQILPQNCISACFNNANKAEINQQVVLIK